MNVIGKVTIGQLDDLNAWSREYSGIDSDSAKLISKAIQEFRKFSNDYLNFFLGLLPIQVRDTPEQSRLWLRALQAFDEYWTPLGEAAAQHLIGPYRTHLDKGTDIAHGYLKKLDVNLPGVVLYFNKVNAIRFVPYTDVAFLAVPYTHIARKDADWLAIPHEIGHYLYWNLADKLVDVRTRHQEIRQIVGSQLRATQKIAERPPQEQNAIVNMALNWIEECFADVVGVKLADVSFTDSFKTLLSEVSDSITNLTEDDGSHPPLCLRPFMREHVLQKLGIPRTGTDWRKLMQDTFGISDFNALTLRTQPPDVENLFRAQSLDDLIALIGGMEDAVVNKIQPIEWKVNDAIEAINMMADLLFDITPNLAESFKQRGGDRSSAFIELRKLAENKAINRQMDPVEVLLTPIVQEGGLRHSHGGYGHFRYHSVGAHNH